MVQTRSSQRKGDDGDPPNNDSKAAAKSKGKGAKSEKKAAPEAKAAPEESNSERQDMVVFEERWSKMQAGITKLKDLLESTSEEQFNSTEYVELYTTIYMMCTQRGEHQDYIYCLILYDRYKEVFQEYLKSTVAPALRGKHGGLMLKELVRRWNNHKIMVRWLSRFFSYLDRFFIPRRGLPGLSEVGLKVFGDLVFSEVKGNAKDACLELINREREGEQIDRALLKNVSGFFVEIGMGDMGAYETDFESFVLQDTAAYYSIKASSWIEEDSCPEYMLRAEERLKMEKERVDHYLHASSEKNLLEKTHHELLVQHQTQLLEKENSGCHVMLRDDQVDDLSRIYRLFLRVPKSLEPVAASFRQYVTVAGTGLVKQAEDAANSKNAKNMNVLNTVGVQEHGFMEKVIDLHEKCLNYVSECFANNSLFHLSLKEAFAVFCNKSVAGSTSAELLAMFCDSLLRKGASKLRNEEIEDTLEKVVKVLAYISDKDLFAEFYRKKLARRLLFGQSADNAWEKRIVTMLKQQHGGQFTSKMEGMLKDMDVSPDRQTEFENYLSELQIKPGLEMSVTILTTGIWPTYKSSNLILPAEMEKAVNEYVGYYEQNVKRRLTWIYSMGTCNVKGNFDAKPIDLIVTPLQAAILLLFNAGHRLSYNHIKDELNLTDEDIVRLLHSLSCAKYKILDKYPNTKTVGQSDTFEFNAKFTDKMRRIKIPSPPMDEKKKVIQDVDKERQYVIDACIVRLMKSRKQLPYQRLILESIELCSRTFKPDVKLIKKRIEDLISREFLERDRDDPSMFKYIA